MHHDDDDLFVKQTQPVFVGVCQVVVFIEGQWGPRPHTYTYLRGLAQLLVFPLVASSHSLLSPFFSSTVRPC